MTSIQVNSKFEWSKWPLKSIRTCIRKHFCLPSYSVPESWHIFVKWRHCLLTYLKSIESWLWAAPRTKWLSTLANTSPLGWILLILSYYVSTQAFVLSSIIFSRFHLPKFLSFLDLPHLMIPPGGNDILNQNSLFSCFTILHWDSDASNCNHRPPAPRTLPGLTTVWTSTSRLWGVESVIGLLRHLTMKKRKAHLSRFISAHLNDARLESRPIIAVISVLIFKPWCPSIDLRLSMVQHAMFQP